MRILRVRFLNINSLRGQWEIDFDRPPISESGLFAITGPTGSGKSSILDAITVALYGEVPRYGNSRPEELMTRHTGESFSEVEFEVRGEVYRSKWAIYRARKKPGGKLQPVQMELVEVAANRHFDLKPSEVPHKIEAITGLDKHRFMRSVMLAQGDFAAFLQAKEKERGELLEKITGLEIYSEISREAFEREKIERRLLEDAQGKIEADRLLSHEAKAALQDEQQKNQSEIAGINKQLAEFSDQITWLNEITSLEKNLAETAAEITANLRRQEEFQEQAKRLQRHQDLLPLRSDFVLLESKLAEIVEQEDALKKARHVVANLNEDCRRLQNIAREKQAELQQAAEKLKSDALIIEQVKSLDLEISHAQKSVDEKEASFHIARDELGVRTQNLAELKKLAQNNAQSLQEIESWIQHHAQIAELEKELPLIKNQLERIEALRQSYSKADEEFAAYTEELENLQEEQQSVAAKLEKISEELQHVRREREQTEQAVEKILQNKTRELFETEIQLRDKQETKLVILQENAFSYAGLKDKAAESAAEIIRLQEEIEATEKELSQISKDKTSAEKERDLLQQIVEKNRRIAKYEKDRQHLKTGEACPLCGALDHPFAADQPEIALDADEKSWQQQIEICKKLTDQQNAIQVHLKGLQTSLEKENPIVTNINEQLNEITKKFTVTSNEAGFDFEIGDLPQIKKALQALQSAQIEARKQAAALRDFETGLKKLMENDNALKQQEIGLAKELESLKKLVHTKKREHEKQRKIRDVLADDGKNIRAKLDAILEKYGEKTPGATETGSFEQQIQGKILAFSRKSEMSNELKDQKISLISQIEAAEKNVEEKKAACTLLESSLKKEQEALEKLHHRRFEIFADKDPVSVAQTNQQNVDLASESLEKANEKFSAARMQVEKQETTVESITNSLKNARQYHTRLDQDFTRKIAEFGIESKEEYRSAWLNDEEIEEISRTKKQLENEASRLAGTKEKTTAMLKKEKTKALTTAAAEELFEQRRALDAQRSTLEQKIGEIRQKLQQDAELKSEFERLAGEIEKQRQVWQQWRRLSELIGSADGTKFSRFAQGLTLARLVQLANLHLKKLHDRYAILKKAESDLELQIIDRYQADTIRDMRSLSGGESFLVSLALALGLSDLASRKNRIDSLFIDEGFGSLDAEMLETAISTLENLQQTGKSIGIISHVQALKERLTTQIQLTKQSGGVSTISIIEVGAQIPGG